MKRLLLIMLSVVFLFGCTPYSPSYYPEEDLIVYPMRNAIYYEYQKKVAIQIRYSSNKTDSLSLRIKCKQIQQHQAPEPLQELR